MPRRDRFTLAMACVISMLLHLLLLPLVRGSAEPQPEETTGPIALETPWPRRSPKPTPTPTPIFTPRPSEAPVPLTRTTARPVLAHRPLLHPRATMLHQMARAYEAPREPSAGHVATGTGEIGSGNGPFGGDAVGTPGPTTPALTPSPEPTPTKPPECAQPNVAAATLDPVVPDTPPVAQAQGISGDVTVIVSLDVDGHVVAARVASSPSVLLNAAALQAARASTFRTEIRECRPVAADYAFIVEFSEQ